MIILKSFFRKRTTRIYLVIIACILTTIFYLVLNRQITYKEGVEFYEGSKTIFVDENPNLEEKIKDIKNVKSVTFSFQTNNQRLYLIEDSEISRGNAIYLSNESETEKQTELTINGYSKNFIITETIAPQYHNTPLILYISEEDFNDLKEHATDFFYIVEFKDTLKRYETTDIIEDTINIEAYMHYNSQKYPSRAVTYEDDINRLTVFAIIGGILFLIILIITIKNILLDEKKNNRLYFCLGYNKKQIQKNNFKKIISLIAISLILAIILTILLYILI